MTDDRAARLVRPFYLNMMRFNAIEADEALLRSVSEASRQATSEDVIALLRDPWRSTVMGAWISLAHSDDRVTGEVLAALDRSHGSLDAPPLVAAATVLAASTALPSLAQYAQRDAAANWGALPFVVAAIEYLSGTSAIGQSDEPSREMLTAMVGVANALRAGE
jgi:hypothetical protein